MWKTEYNQGHLGWMQQTTGSDDHCYIAYDGVRCYVRGNFNTGFNGNFGWCFI